MIRFIKEYFRHSDERGSIRGLINVGTWEELNMIQSDSHTIRGNHYHEQTEELFVIIEGKIKVILQSVDQHVLVGNAEEYTVNAGDVFIIEKGVHHRFEIMESARWINALARRSNPDQIDILRVTSHGDSGQVGEQQ